MAIGQQREKLDRPVRHGELVCGESFYGRAFEPQIAAHVADVEHWWHIGIAAHVGDHNARQIVGDPSATQPSGDPVRFAHSVPPSRLAALVTQVTQLLLYPRYQRARVGRSKAPSRRSRLNC
jgi:hypothetical protein